MGVSVRAALGALVGPPIKAVHPSVFARRSACRQPIAKRRIACAGAAPLVQEFAYRRAFVFADSRNAKELELENCILQTDGCDELRWNLFDFELWKLRR